MPNFKRWRPTGGVTIERGGWLCLWGIIGTRGLVGSVWRAPPANGLTTCTQPATAQAIARGFNGHKIEHFFRK